MIRPNLARFRSAEKIALSDVPEYLRSSEYYQSFLEMERDGEEDNEEKDVRDGISSVPLDCRKINTSVRNSDDLHDLLSTLRFWIATKFPADVIKFSLTNEDTYHRVLLNFQQDLIVVRHLLGIIHWYHYEDNSFYYEEQHWREVEGYYVEYPRCIPIPPGTTTELCQVELIGEGGFGQINFINYFLRLGTEWTEALCCHLAACTMLESLEYIREQGKLIPLASSKKVFTAAASTGSIASLKYLKTTLKGTYWTTSACQIAAQYGHLACLQFLHENGCSWDEETVLAARLYGHEECEAYARKHDCKAFRGDGRVEWTANQERAYRESQFLARDMYG